MKKYNRPVVEIRSFEVEDVIAASIYFTGYDDTNELQGVYNEFVNGGGDGDTGSTAAVFEW